MKTVLPKTGANHKLFGTKYKDRHKMSDADWTASDKINQYRAMALIHEKNHELLKEGKLLQNQQIAEDLKNKCTELKMTRQQVKDSTTGQALELKRVLCNHKDLQLQYLGKPLEMIVQDMDNRIYTKRKELDRVLYRRNQLADLYKKEIVKVSQLQDQIAFGDLIELPGNVRSKELVVKIKDAKTRIKVVESLNKHCRAFIETAMNDSLYFDPILDAVKEDLDEQQDFFKHIIEMGGPAIENVDILKKHFSELTNDIINPTLNLQRTNLYKFRELMKTNAERIRGLIRTDFKTYPNRYSRETPSMLDLKADFQGVERSIKQTMTATASSTVNQIFERFQREAMKKEEIVVKIENCVKNLDGFVEKLKVSDAEMNARVNNSTKENITEREKMEEVVRFTEIEKDKVKQNQELIQNISSVMLEIRKSFIHFDALLKNVGEKPMPVKRTYQKSYLNLAILNLTDNSDSTEVIEEDLDVIVERVMEKAQSIMSKFDEDAKDGDIALANNVYHDAILAELSTGMDLIVPKKSLSLEFDSVDGSVPDRGKIKTLSRKMVAENKKEDE